MALQVASLFGVLSLNDDNFKAGLNNAKTGMQGVSGQLKTMGQGIQSFGSQLALVSAPLAGAFGVAVNASMEFDEAVTNTGAVMGKNRDEIEALKKQLLEIGSGTRAGPQAVAEAMYDIAGGVADSSTHMAILNAAIHTSQAGNASLAGTTKALVSTMNSYNYSADEAAKVSDVLTRTVGMGVGSMEEFASALPQVTGLAASLGIPLEDVGSMMAFLTTKGNSASEASTQLGANMSALMKPNADMAAALKELGFSSGQAAIEQLGLVGALQAIANSSTANEKGLAALLGTQEAVRGSTALLGEDFKGFNATYQESIDGITAKTEEIQMGSAAAQFDLLKSQVSELAIKAGDALVPALTKIWEQISPIITNVVDWIGKNPELTTQIGLLALGGFALGGILSVVGTVVGVLSGAMAILLAPVGLLALGIGAIIYAADKLYPGGIVKLFNDAATAAGQLGVILFGVGGFAQFIKDRVAELVKTIQDFKTGVEGIVGIAGLVTSGKVSVGDVVNAVGDHVKDNAGGNFDGIADKYWGQKANGGPVMGGGMYLVGEQGPELFTPSSSGHISTASETAAMMGNTYYINISANTYDGGQAAERGFMDAVKARGG